MSVLGYAVLGQTLLGLDEDWSTGGASATPSLAMAGGDRFTPGDVVHLVFKVTDTAGAVVDPTGTLTLVVRHESGLEDDVTGLVANDTVGTYAVDYTPGPTGRYVATITWVGGDYAGEDQIVFDVQPLDVAFVSLPDLRAYQGMPTATDAELTEALQAERDDQAEWCRVDPYTYPLRGALIRRVARNLAARRAPVAQVNSFGQTSTGVVVTAQLDTEIARLEAPRRKAGFA